MGAGAAEAGGSGLERTDLRCEQPVILSGWRVARFIWMACLLAGCAPRPEGAPQSSRLEDESFLAEQFGPPAASGPYFPPPGSQSSILCDYGRGQVREPILGAFHARWFSQHLAAAGEPSLFLASQRTQNPGNSTLRFTWLRTFHPPVIIRIDNSNGTHRLTAKQLSGAGGYAPGRIARTVSRDLSADEVRSLRTLLTRNQFFQLPGATCVMGLDGAEWAFEQVNADGYRLVRRWSPTDGPAHEVGLFLIGLTGWRFEMPY